MSEANTESGILDRRSNELAFSDLVGGPPGEWRCAGGVSTRIQQQPRGDHAALPHISLPNLATSIRVCTSYTSVDLWYVNLDVPTEALNSFKQWLSADELVRAERFQWDLHRARYIVGRGALRCLLADQIGCSPAAVRFSYGPNGKPVLEGGRGRVEFNLAHSGGSAAIAITDGAAIGVDIELLRPIADIESLARLVFSDAERRELELAPDPVLTFLNGWTRKEAYVKALGLGLTAPLTQITVSLSEKAALLSTGFPDQSPSNWRLLNVPHPRAVAALALGSKSCNSYSY